MILIKVREKVQEGMRRVRKLVRMIDVWRAEGVAKVRIEGKGGVVGIRCGEAVDVALSNISNFVIIYILIL